jgi:hypothetical protein
MSQAAFLLSPREYRRSPAHARERIRPAVNRAKAELEKP